MPTITTKDGTEIFYKDWGTGQPIVFSHGWPLSADDWDTQMLFFLGNGFRVIAHDRRGHGRSSPDRRRPRHGSLRRRPRGADRASRPEGRHPCRPLHRRRRGGALPRPPRREPGGEGGDHQRGAAADGEDRRPIPAACPRRCSTACRRSSPPTARSSIATCRPGRSTASTGRARKPSEAVIQNWWRQGMMGGAKAHYDGIVAFSQTDFTEDLKKITVPVLVMHGDDDQIVPYADSGAAVGQAAEERHAEDLQGLSARHADHAGRHHQRRPAGVHQGMSGVHPDGYARSSPDMKVILFGATGMVGQGVLRECLRRSGCRRRCWWSGAARPASPARQAARNPARGFHGFLRRSNPNSPATTPASSASASPRSAWTRSATAASDLRHHHGRGAARWRGSTPA